MIRKISLILLILVSGVSSIAQNTSTPSDEELIVFDYLSIQFTLSSMNTYVEKNDPSKNNEDSQLLDTIINNYKNRQIHEVVLGKTIDQFISDLKKNKWPKNADSLQKFISTYSYSHNIDTVYSKLLEWRQKTVPKSKFTESEADKTHLKTAKKYLSSKTPRTQLKQSPSTPEKQEVEKTTPTDYSFLEIPAYWTLILAFGVFSFLFYRKYRKAKGKLKVMTEQYKSKNSITKHKFDKLKEDNKQFETNNKTLIEKLDSLENEILSRKTQNILKGKTNIKQQPLKVSIPQPTYTSSPEGDLFIPERITDIPNERSTIYKITPIDETRAKISFIANPKIHYKLEGNIDSALRPVCDILISAVGSVNKINHSEDGEAVKQGDNWKVVTKLKIEFI
jgi:hypothetical protein